MSQVPVKGESGQASPGGNTPGESPGDLAPAWQEAQPLPGPALGIRSTRFPAALLAAILLASLGSTAGLISWFGRNQTPLLIPLIVTEYEQPWIVPVPMGQKDLELLTSGKVFDRVQPVPAKSPDRMQMLATLADLEKVRASESIVMYVSTRAVAGPDGKLLLLPSDARVENVRGVPTMLNVISLEDLFRALAKCPASRKLLILDIFHTLISVPQGMLSIDLPAMCKDELEAMQKDGSNPFHVLMTCAPGQRSYMNISADASPFCHFLAKAVNGELPGATNSNLNRFGKVFVSDIQDILTRHVDRWTSYCNLARQTPVMLGNGPDMLLGLPKIRYVPSQVIAAKLSDYYGRISAWVPFKGKKGPAEDSEKPAGDDPSEAVAKGQKTDKKAGKYSVSDAKAGPKEGGRGGETETGAGKDPEGASPAGAGDKPGQDGDKKAGDSAAPRGDKDAREGSVDGKEPSGAKGPDQGSPSEPLKIPPDVEAAWALLEKWTNEGVEVNHPRLMNRLSELARQGLTYHLLGVDEKKYSERLQYETRLIRTELDRRKSELPSPTVLPSLGMMMAEGLLQEQPETPYKTFQKAVLSIDPAKSSAADAPAQFKKAAEDWAKANPAVGKAGAELAAVTAMISLPNPTPADWRAAAELLANLQGEAKTSEGRLLTRLGRGMPGSGIDSSLAQTSLTTLLRCNQAAGRWRCYSEIGTIMENMMENCSGGIWLVENSPRLHGTDAMKLLWEARRAAVFVEGFEQVYNESRSIIWHAVQDFAAFESFPSRLPPGWGKYSTRMEQIIELFQQLRTSRDLTRPDIEKIVSRLRIAAQDLAKSYLEVHVAVQPEGIQEFVRVSESENASPAVLPEIISALRLGGQPLKNRLTLIRCYIQISRRILEKVSGMEDRERKNGTPAPARPDYDEKDPAQIERRLQENRERVGLITQRLGLLGVPEADLATLRLAARANPGGNDQLLDQDTSRTISTLFLAKVPELIDSDPNAALRANLSYPGWLFNKTLDQPGSNPSEKVILAEREDYLFWVVNRLRHESLMGLDRDFNSEMAGLFGHQFNRKVTSEVVVSQPQPLELKKAGEEKLVQVTWTGDLTRFQDVAPKILRTRQGPFTVEIRDSVPTGSGGVINLVIRRDASAEAPTLTGYEFVLELSIGARKWYSLLSVIPDDDGSRPSLVISDPEENGQVFGETLSLRGSGFKKSVAVRLRQESGKAENLAVTIKPSRSAGTGLWGPANIPLPAGVSTNLAFDGFLSVAPAGLGNAGAPEKPAAGSPRQLATPGELVFEIRDLAKVSDPVVTRSLKILRVDPGELVEIVSATVAPASGQGVPTSNLRVEIRAKRPPIAGPPCQVELTVDGITGGKGIRGNTRGTVPPDGDPLVLEAQGIPSVGAGAGMFTVSVDGVPLTYRFSADFAVFDRVEGASLQRVPFMGLKASMAQEVTPPEQGSTRSPGVRLEAWACQAPAGSTLRLKLLGGDRFENIEKLENLPGPIESVATVEAGEKGVWNFSLKEGRWNRLWNSEGMAGRKKVRLELVGATGQVIAAKETDLVIDSTPPRFGQFFGYPEKLAPGTSRRFTFLVSDEESGIRSVQAYLGPPQPPAQPADKTPAAPSVPPPVVEVNTSGNAWEAAVDVPADAKGSVTLTIRAENGSGLETVWSRAIPVADVPAPTVGGLNGKVTEGGRPQPGLPVVLKDEKGKEAQKAISDKDGAYQFEGLKPGKYTVEAKKTSSGRGATAKVEIKAGPPAVANLNLLE